jgi:hypothetical protein
LGAFFLLTGTVLFFAGLGCLVLVFVSITRRLSASTNASVYYRSRGSYRDTFLAGVGIVLIIGSQGFYWFFSEIEKFIPFAESVPEMRISFLYEEYRTPRIIIQSSDPSHQITAQMVPLEEDSAAIGVEVLKWGKIGRLLGLQDCYHINGIYYKAPDSTKVQAGNLVPDYALFGGPSGFAASVGLLGRISPGEWKFLISDPIAAAPETHYNVQITPVIIFAGRTVDKKPVASYPNPGK